MNKSEIYENLKTSVKRNGCMKEDGPDGKIIKIYEPSWIWWANKTKLSMTDLKNIWNEFDEYKIKEG